MAKEFNTLTTIRDRVPYDELAEYRSAFRMGEPQEVVRILATRWDRRHDLIKALLPKVEIGAFVHLTNVSKWETGVQDIRRRMTLSRYEPEAHPKYTWLYAVAAEEVEGLGAVNKNADLIEFRQGTGGNLGGAKIAVTYRTLPYNLTPAGHTNATINVDGVWEWLRYISVKAKPAGKNLPLPGSTFREAIATGNQYLPVGEAGAMTVSEVHLAYTWHQCPKVPETATLFMGCTNQVVFDNVNRNFPFQVSTQGVYGFEIGSILYLYPEISDFYHMPDGTRVCDVTYHFLYRRDGHNKVFRPLAGRWMPVFRTITAATTAPPSPDANFRYPARYNIHDYVDLNKLFAILEVP